MPQEPQSLKIENFKTQFEEYLKDNLPTLSPMELFEPYKYLMLLDAKRIRPALMMAAHSFYKPIDDKVLQCAMAVEIFHNFSLMHDDIMDNSDTRRGKPSVHKKYSENSAILSGDAMLILSYQLLEKLKEDKNFHQIFNVYNDTAIKICIGQQLDMNFENEIDINEMEYLMMIEHKTAVLLAASLKIGGLLSGASQEDCDLLYSFGINIGMGFQIQDDILDTFGTEAKVGKKIGMDIVNNKKTLLFIRTLQNAHKTHKELLLNWLQTSEFNEDKIKDITQAFKDSGSLNYCIEKKKYYYENALKSVAKLSISENHKSFLIKFADKVVNREK